LEASEQHRKDLDKQMKDIKKDLFQEVNTLQNNMYQRMDKLTDSLASVEKYMWRQNVIQGMRDKSARKKRQERVRSQSPPRTPTTPTTNTEDNQHHLRSESPLRYEMTSVESGGLSTAERRKLEQRNLEGSTCTS